MKRKERKVLKRIILIVVIMAVVATSVYLVFKFRNVPDSPNILSADAEKGSIVMSVVSSGNVANGSLIDQQLPIGIKIDKVLVEKGDMVEAGEALAIVNDASVKSQISLLEEEIRNIDKEINTLKGNTEASTIKSNVSGRIKKLNATVGDDVIDVMLEHKGLALLSVDGKMAVTFENSSLTLGQKVNVYLEDTSKVTGTVESIKDGSCTVTLTDNGPKLDETVIIKDGNDDVVGDGTLYINQPVTVVASSGKVKTINIGLNGYVSNGSTIITLEGLPPSAEFMEQMSKRNDKADTLLELVKLSKNNTLYASNSGTISSVNIEAGTVTSKGGMQTAGTEDFTSSLPFDLGLLSTKETTEVSTLKAKKDRIHNKTESNEIVNLGTVTTNEITNGMVLQGLFRVIPTTGSTPVLAVETDEFVGYIVFTPSDAIFMPDTQYVADITLIAKPTYIFPDGFVPNFGLDIVVSNVAITGNSPGNTLTFRLVFPKTSTLDGIIDLIPDDLLGGLFSGISLDDLIPGLTGGLNIPDYSSLLGSNDYNLNSTSDNENMMNAIVIASNENMLLTVEVDELDILKIQKGQQASITFDAIPNKEFEAVISRISSASESVSGVARYNVELTIGKDTDMRSGMNATAKIEIDSKDNIVKIPVDAIQEQVGVTYVYTESDNGLLGGEKEITTGISDGEFVEVVSGLDEGTTVYYEMKARGFSFFNMYDIR